MRFNNIWVLLFVALMLIMPASALAVDSFWWSVKVKQGHAEDKITTISHLLGENKLKHYKLGEYNRLLQSGQFEFGIIPLKINMTGQVTNLDVCKTSFDLDKFNLDLGL